MKESSMINRPNNKNIMILVIVICSIVSSCATAGITPELVQKHLFLVIPDGIGKFPVVIFYQGTGGDNRRAENWASWFKTMGVASAIVDNASIRNRTQNPQGSIYTEDGAIAWDILHNNPQIDTSRFALMGFSRGGQQVLEAAPLFKDKRLKPSFVFALYPGGWGPDKCFCKHKKPTEVHIFLGDQDDVSRYDGISPACRNLARRSDNIEFHEIKGATHGYDDIYTYTFELGRGKTAKVVPNAEAVNRTKEIIEKAIRAGWNLVHDG